MSKVKPVRACVVCGHVRSVVGRGMCSGCSQRRRRLGIENPREVPPPQPGQLERMSRWRSLRYLGMNAAEIAAEMGLAERTVLRYAARQRRIELRVTQVMKLLYASGLWDETKENAA